LNDQQWKLAGYAIIHRCARRCFCLMLSAYEESIMLLTYAQLVCEKREKNNLFAPVKLKYVSCSSSGTKSASTGFVTIPALKPGLASTRNVTIQVFILLSASTRFPNSCISLNSLPGIKIWGLSCSDLHVSTGQSAEKRAGWHGVS